MRRVSVGLSAVLLLLVSAACEPQRRDEASSGEVAERTATAMEVALGSSDAVLRDAAAALRDGRPWDATRRVHSRVAGDRARQATAPVVVLAAQAAVAWGGWSEAQRLLATAAWRTGAHAGEGYELLARSALERNAAPDAAAFADSALRAPTDALGRGIRLALLARALDRMNVHDSAAATYRRAAQRLPVVADWLALRAAGVTVDAGAREKLYDAVRSPAAQARVAWTEALALEAGGDAAGAARLYDSLGARVPALRLRIARAVPGSPDRAALRAQTLGVVDLPRSADEWRQAVDLLERSFPDRAAAEELRIARSATRHGTAARAVAGFAAAVRAGLPLTDQDHYDYANALTRLGRWQDAAGRFEQVSPAAPIRARAAYGRARALLRAGNGAAARTALRDVATRYANDGTAAASALYLLADLATDEGRDAAARAAWRELVTRYPRSDVTSEAAFRAATVAFIAGDVRTAAAEWDAAGRLPDDDEALASRYWSGRAHARLGDTATARARWREVLTRSKTSYYAMLAARRLNVPVWTPAPSDETSPPNAMVAGAMQRIALLDSLGLDTEAGHERTAMLDSATGNTSAMLAAAAALRDAGHPSRAIALARRVADGGVQDARTYRLLYPLVHREGLIAAARAARLDPALVAALVRQESSFNPRAVSPVGARGLMQLMPTVGRSIARARDYPLWDDDLLFQPTVSFDLGTAHLAGDLGRHRDLARALAAYNAGASRVTRWVRKAGVADPELFTERIPYVETRDYVRIVQRNVEMYRALYGL